MDQTKYITSETHEKLTLYDAPQLVHHPIFNRDVSLFINACLSNCSTGEKVTVQSAGDEEFIIGPGSLAETTLVIPPAHGHYRNNDDPDYIMLKMTSRFQTNLYEGVGTGESNLGPQLRLCPPGD